MHATFVFNKSGLDKLDLVHPIEGQEPTRVKQLATKGYNSQVDAMFDFEKRIEKIQNDKRGCYAILLHTTANIESAENVILVKSLKKGSFDTITTQNPFFRNSVKPKRNILFKDTAFQLTRSMHSQLFGMLDKSAFDQKLMERYSLNDIQKDNIYGFQQKHFEPKSVMSREQVLRLVRNVLSSMNLPWIDLYFLEDGDAAFFAVNMGEGKKFKTDEEPDDDNDPEQGVIPLEADPNDNPLLNPIDMEIPDSITINKMSLHLPETWALNQDVIVHELAHYYCFMAGLNVPFFNKRHSFDPDTFTLVFSSHGKLFCTVFAHLLMRFCYIDKVDLYNTLDVHGVSYYKIDRLDEKLLFDCVKKEFEDNPKQALV